MNSNRKTRPYAAIFLWLLLGSPLASAVTLYKLVDRDGKVSYVQERPADFQGQAVPMQIDPAVNAVAPNPVHQPEKPKEATKPGEPKKMGYLEQKRATRDALELRLKTARDRLDAAKDALAKLQMGDDEFQVIMRPVSAGSGGGFMGGQAKLGCSTVVQNFRAVQACGAVVPNEKFVQRANALEEAVKLAEAEVEEAEIAWRRGVD